MIPGNRHGHNPAAAPRGTRIYLITALYPEARPFIDHFRLKQVTIDHAIPVYRNDELFLAVSGVGKARSATALTYMMTRFQTTGETIAVNAGIAGSAQKENNNTVRIGDLFLINKIVDPGAGREYFPDILMNSGLAEATVTTVDRPLDRRHETPVEEGLVDMEASGFFQAAAMFLPPHRIVCVKVVSDFLETTRPDRAWVSGLMAPHVSRIEALLDVCRNLPSVGEDPLTDADHAMLSGARHALRLTESQTRMLLEAARGYKLCTGSDLTVLTPFSSLAVSSKKEGKQHFERLLQRLMDA